MMVDITHFEIFIEPSVPALFDRHEKPRVCASGHLVPGTAAMPEKPEVTCLHQQPQMQFQCVPIDPGECERRRKCHAAMLSCNLEQLLVNGGQGSHQSFALHLLFERILLLLETQQKETHPIDEA